MTGPWMEGDAEMDRARNPENREGGGVHFTKAEGTMMADQNGRGGMDDRTRWARAAHAMQSGVAVAIERHLDEGHTPKHLRTGVNVALTDHGSLAALLIKKGLITEAEYLKAIADGMEAEQKNHEDRLSEALGAEIKLG